MKIRVTEELIERAAKEVYGVSRAAVAHALGMMVWVRPWDELTKLEQDLHRDYARAAFSALFPKEDEAA